MTSGPEPPRHVVTMGVSGCGKTAVGEHVAATLGWTFIEGDQYHPRANIEKMSSGHPLDDEDRRPWLEALGDLVRAHDAGGRSTVLACSALKRSYRDILRQGSSDTFFVHLHGDFEVLLERVSHREHFMPPSLLQSQFDTLEVLGSDESGTVVDVAPPLAVVRRDAERAVRAWLDATPYQV